MKLTINDLLNNDLLEGIKIVGGVEQRNRKITNLTFMDNPESITFLNEGELLITTGFAIKDDEELQDKIIREMAALKCSGLAIKIKRYFDHIPARMIELADEYQLPLLEIPFEHSLSTVASIVYKEIVNTQAYYLQKSEEIHQNLTKVALRQGNLEEILKYVGNIMNNPIVVLDSSWRLLSYYDDRENNFPIEEYLVLKKGQQVFSPAFFENIHNEVKHWDKALEKEFMLAGRTIECKIYPIAANGTIYGYMVIIECVRELNRIDYIAMQHAGTIIALERIKAKAVEETKHQIRSDFYDDLLSGKIESVNAIKSLSEIHGLDTTKQYVCMVVKLDYTDVVENKEKIVEKEKEDIKLDIGHAADRIAYQYNRKLVSIFRGNQVIILLQLDDSDSKQVSVKELCLNFATELYMELSERDYYYAIRIGIGKVYPQLLEISRSFTEALDAVYLGKKLNKAPVVHFEDLFIYHFLNTCLSKEEMGLFVSNTVQKLYEYDLENNSNLVSTLETYYDCVCNVTEAAKRQFMHRNTIKYRLEKIKELLGKDIDQPEILLELNLGLKLLHLIHQNENVVVVTS
ncbi:PucR family transcriptional regulator [Bacillus rubiinfantis]|uniref:PucR family transcriptional regulator n=1 Tax=Bacillus rubiinfantis TaxID=1499680 RepID=UPI0005A6C995|nr:PucR family transcriptional regulator [Bacillus rubiinfantis]